MPERPRVFLAHASDDKKLVRELHAQLKKRGLQPWLDEEDLLPGQNWTTEIPKAIRECEFFVACLSQNSIRKQGYVQKEFRMALDIYAQKPSGTIYLIPLKFDDCEVPAIELPQLGIDLRHIQWVDYWKSDGLSRLLKAIDQTQTQESGDSIFEPEQTAPLINDSAEPTQSKIAKRSHPPHQPMPSWIPAVSVTSALVFLAVLLMLAVFIPEPTDFQMFIFRIVLALAAAAFGATIPGFFRIKLPLPAKGLLHAGGVLALFALIYLGMEFVCIKPGTFMMGSPTSEKGRYDDESLHEVKLTKGYYLQTTEVTQSQWQVVMGNNPSKFKSCGENCPVENISWDDIQEFIKELNQHDSKYQYRLPTEAEWEYAARAGTTTTFSFGETLSTDQANYNGNYPYGNGPKGIDREKTTPVKSFPANAWGLYDMHGNVWEWCQDRYGDYPNSSVTDPQGPSSGTGRVLRGSSWSSIARYCRSANRGRDDPSFRYGDSGFRLVASLVSR